MLPETNQLLVAHFVFAFFHFTWFVIYYSRYSTLNQKITGIEKMLRAGVITEELASLNVSRINERLKRMKKISLYPVPFITVAHCLYFLISAEFVKGLPVILAVSAGSVVLVLLANLVKGSQVIDPNKRFRRTYYD